MPRRATASLSFSCHARPAQLYVNVFGSLAQATASLDGRSFRIVRGASLPGPFARVQWVHQDYRQMRRELWRHLRALVAARLHYFQGMYELMRRFYLAIEGRGDMPVPMADAIRTTRIMEEIIARTEDAGDGR